MKLRLRPFDSKETLKIDVQDSCTIPQFKQILSQTLPNFPSPASIRLSLNRKDELQSAGEDSLHSLGIAAGDLVYFSLEQPAVGMNFTSQSALSPETGSTLNLDSKSPECSTDLNAHNTLYDAQKSDSVNLVSPKRKTLDGGSEMENFTDDEGGESSYNTDALVEEVVDKSFSVPGFLRKVFMEELGDDSGRHHKLTVIAVHAVMLESGFGGFDKKPNVVGSGFHLRNEWPSGLFRMSLFYTLPESISGARGKSIKNVMLKFQSLGKFMNVYGTLENGSGKSSTHWVQLNEDQLVPYLNVVWTDCGVQENINGEDGGILDTYAKEVFKFWRIVKDNLAFPLLIDLCEESGLELPPCFMRLPTDLKLKILKFLPGVEIAKVNCVSSELQYLGSSDDLWKLKFAEEFGNCKTVAQEAKESWKKEFTKVWHTRKAAELLRPRFVPFIPAPRRRYPNLFMAPQVPQLIGDDLDIPPPFGDDLETVLQDFADHRTLKFQPQCNLGVRGSRFI